ELSDEDAPSYIDVSTLERPSPALDDPHLSSSSSNGALAPIPSAGNRSPVEAPALHTAEPASKRRHKRKVDRPPYVLYLATALMFVVTMLASWSVLDKATSSWKAAEAATHLQLAVREHIEPLLKVLPTEDQKELETLWFAMQDADGADRGARATDLADALVIRAQSRELNALAETHLAQLRASLRARVDTQRTADLARASWVGQVTGPLGVFDY
ncbi:MAG: hypothetical protein AAF602_11965, partial [Myxococcota bacterium]